MHDLSKVKVDFKTFKLSMCIILLHFAKLPPSLADSNGRPLNFVVNVCFVCRFCVAYWVNLPSFNHLQCTMSGIFDWEVRRLGMRDTLRHGTITVSGFGYFHKNCRFLWEKNASKTNLGSTIHYTYTSYN